MTRAKDISKILTDADFSGTLDVTGETTLATHLNMGDNDIIKLGAGADLQIYHDGSHSYISDQGTGNLRIAASDRIQFYNAATDEVTAQFIANGEAELRYDNTNRLATTSTGIDVTGTALNLDGGGSNPLLTLKNSATYYSTVSHDTFNVQNNALKLSTQGTERMRIDSSGSVAIGSTSTAGADRLTLKGSTTDSSTNLLVRNSADVTLLALANDKTFNVQGVYDQTTSSGANVNVASDGHIRRSTSSLRYKNTVSNATHGLTELLTLRSVIYKGNNDGDTVFGGLIAEEVHDAGLTEFVQYDDDGQPDALAYGNMVSLCIKAIQELKTELDEAKARITALETA
jgi:hypothetical protein